MKLPMFVAAALAAAAFAGLASEASADYSAKVDNDTLNLVGDDAGDKLTVFVDTANVLVDVGEDGSIDFTLDSSTFSAISVKAQGGDDQVRIQHVSSQATESITVDGGTGNDTLIGGFMAETLIGGAGNDFVDGNLGADTVQLGSGNDTFNWDPGDSNDTVEGQGGTDVVTFNGSNIGEALRVAANGSRVTLERNIANIVMDLDGMERIKFLPRGGTDAISVEDVTGTDLDVVEADLGGDDTPDSLTKRGTEGPDAFKVSPTEIIGVGARTTVTGADATGDSHGIAALGGDDTLATGLGVTGTAVVTFDGGGGDDTVNYSGTNDAEAIHVVANGVFTRVSSPPSAETDLIAEHLNVLARGEADTVTGTGNLAALTSITMDGGSGNDTLLGSNGADTLIGSTGTDFADGQQGTDTALLGSGNDTFQWDPGDGNDSVDGQGGDDGLSFNGSNIGEVFHVSANGSRVNLTRNIANITTDMVGMERTMFIPRGGADVITVEDLTGTEMDAVEADFTADGEADSLISRGTEGPDAFKVGPTGITGVGARTRVINGDTTGDFLTVSALGGDDTIATGIVPLGPAWVSIDGGTGEDVTTYSGTAGDDLIAAVANGPVAHVSSPPATEIDVSTERLNIVGGSGADQLSGTGNLAPLTALTFDGGAGDDRVLGGNGADTLLGGSGNDFVDGQQGNDVAFMGSGNDTFQWDPGDGNDTVEGQGGSDAFAFNGSAIGEILDLRANGSRALFTRNIANIATDLNDVERVAMRTLAGNDNVTIGDMTGTDVSVADVDLGAFTGGGDAAQDTVTVVGTDRPDNVKVNRVEDQAVVTGLRAQTRIANSELLNDTLRINTQGGDDRVTVDPNVELLITPVIDLGADGQ
jgi:Ca2+-binding RTX toxin-like protein